ncbi:hypothetical protein B0T17DRAFT_521382 [Bombardia bombarda]|uniref:Uncharacterized protein n=1 Tax=Bombardia bombarda TaxID=252184 RepID=A0AA39XPH9_9PEZI|nr:hypothetical protein B0T17DRAFT_521382 [Bombardia bombarda]
MATIRPPALTAPPPIQLQAAWERHQPPSALRHNPSHCHPVFFTQRLRPQKPLSAMSPQQQQHQVAQHNSATVQSPVAHGYVYQDGRGPRL